MDPVKTWIFITAWRNS